MNKIGIIVSSSRPSRIGRRLADWVLDQAPEGVEAEIIDLAEVDLPFLREEKMPRLGEYSEPSTLAWAETVNRYDGFIVLVAEYNGGYTAVLKNAIDTLFAEWNGKPVATIGYGWGAGARAVSALQPVLETVQAVSIPGPGLSFNTEISVEGEILEAAPAAEVTRLFETVAAQANRSAVA